MADDDDVRDPEIVQRRNDRTGRAVGALCNSWFEAGAGVLAATLRAAANAAEDLTDQNCGRRRRRRASRDD